MKSRFSNKPARLFGRRSLIVAMLTGLAGCATQGAIPPQAISGDLANASSAQCQATLESLDKTVAHAGVFDAEATPVPGYPFLRANRISVALKSSVDANGDGKADSRAVWRDWVGQMRDLDRAARQSELSALDPGIDQEAVQHCADRLAEGLAPSEYARLSKAVFVPNDYRDFQRVAGFYPITAIGVHHGYEKWKSENLGSFKLSQSQLRERGNWQDWHVAGPENLPVDMQTPRDALGLWTPDKTTLARIARAYAPVFRVNVQGHDDEIGAPVWSGEPAKRGLDTDHPVIYYRLAHARFDGKWVPQLVYTIWFPARPAQSAFDILAGKFDGLIWRVTLDQNGRPLIYDSIHPCGCYHLFFPTDLVTRKTVSQDKTIDETAETPGPVLDANAATPPVVWLDSVSHYILAVTPGANQNAAMPPKAHLAAMQPERDLTRLAYPAIGRDRGLGAPATRSFYGPDGFVPGSDRLEWMILWPMGIERPGTMRQWGHHATSFVGKSQFDDPDILAHYFAIRRDGGDVQ